jgi:hypothetical protein
VVKLSSLPGPEAADVWVKLDGGDVAADSGPKYLSGDLYR